MNGQSLTLRQLLEKIRPEDRSGDRAAAAALEQGRVDQVDHHNPWFIRALTAISAWIAAVMLLVFVFGARLVSSDAGHSVLGVVILAGAVLLRRTPGNALFLDQLAFALSLAGQVLFIGGIGGTMHDEAGALAAIMVSVALIFLYPDRNHRFLSTLIALGGAAAFALEVRFNYGIPLLAVSATAAGGHLWFQESRLLPGVRERVLRPVAYGLTAGGLLLLLPSLTPHWSSLERGVDLRWQSAAVALTCLLLLLSRQLLVYHAVERTRTAYVLYAGVVSLGAASLNAPGIACALFVLATGFHRGNRTITGLAFAFFVLFLAAYYYHMQITLLTKSYALLATGSIMLLLRLLLTRAVPGEGEGGAV